MTASDGELIERAVGGDADALRILLQQFGPQARQAIQGQIGRKWRHLLDEDDVMQVTYLEAFLHVNRLHSKDARAFAAWLTRIAENSLRDALRGLERKKRPDPARRVQAPPGQDSRTVLLEFLGVTTTTPSRHAAQNDSHRVLDEEISRLPADYGMVVRLMDLEGQSASEAALSMGRSVGAIHMLRARAHNCLRERLGSASQFFTDPA